MEVLARWLIIFGIVLLLVGGLLYLLAYYGVNFGRLPGDVHIQRGNFTCILTLGTSILLSIVLTLVLNLIVRIINK